MENKNNYSRYSASPGTLKWSFARLLSDFSKFFPFRVEAWNLKFAEIYVVDYVSSLNSFYCSFIHIVLDLTVEWRMVWRTFRDLLIMYLITL